jgi:hypothetical protein
MRKHHLTTAIPCALEFIQNLGFCCIRNRGTVKVGALAVSIPLLLLESSLEVKPLVGQHLATIHTSYGNDHPYTW